MIFFYNKYIIYYYILSYNNTLSLIKYKNYKKLYLTKYNNQYGGDHFLEWLNEAIEILNNFNTRFDRIYIDGMTTIDKEDLLHIIVESNIQSLFKINIEDIHDIYFFTKKGKDQAPSSEFTLPCYVFGLEGLSINL